MKNIIIGLSLLGLILQISCARVKVKTNYEPEMNFTAYRTYSWFPEPEGKFLYLTNPDAARLKIDEKVKNAVNRELQAKGFVLNNQSPDFLIVFHTGMYHKKYIQDWGYAYARSSRYWGGRDDIELRHYKEGTLVLDFVDANSKELIWRGSAVKMLKERPLQPNEAERRINEVVKDVLSHFPPQKK